MSGTPVPLRTRIYYTLIHMQVTQFWLPPGMTGTAAWDLDLDLYMDLHASLTFWLPMTGTAEAPMRRPRLRPM